MRIAFQTICWGDRLKAGDWPTLLRSIAAAGYAGVEIFQNPSTLPTFSELWDMAAHEGVQVLGLTGGTLASRMGYLRPTGTRIDIAGQPEPYLYIEYWGPRCDDAKTERFTLALHYHHLSKLPSVEAARSLLAEHGDSEVKWLPDTAHLFIGDQNTQHLRDLLTDPVLVGQTAAIHLTDWKSIFGRFSHRFTRGFCLPGEGEVGLRAILDTVTKNKSLRDVWGVVELDYTSTHPETEMLASARKLREWGFLNSEPEDTSEVFKENTRIPALPLAFHSDDLLRLASHGDKDFFADLAIFLVKETKAAECFVCSVINATDQATVRARFPHPPAGAMNRDEAKKFARKVAQEKRTLVEGQLLGVPVFNLFNPNMVRHVLLYPYGAGFQKSLAEDSRFTACIAHAIDNFVTQRCQVIAAEAVRLATKHRDPAELLENVAHLLRDYLHCQGVTIFLSSVTGDALTVGGTTGIEWASNLSLQNQKVYPSGQGLTGRVGTSRSYKIYRYAFTIDRPDDSPEPRSSEIVPDKNKDIDSCLSACFFNDKDEVAGVVRCRNPIGHDGNIIYFSEDDLALVEAVMHAVQSELNTLSEDRRNAEALTVLSHELSNPIFALRGAIDDIGKNIDAYRKNPSKPILQFDYLEDMDAWLDSMVLRLKEYEFFLQRKLYRLEPHPATTKFFGDVVAPLVRQFRIPLQQSGFSPKGIDYGVKEDWDNLPTLYIDRDMFDQVTSNLLNNAIKYAYRDQKQFGVRIWGEQTGDGVQIHFEDKGIGIDKKWREAIFTRGGRVTEQIEAVVPGYGLGLWLVRSLVELHGGRIDLSKCKPDPTRFTIWLPKTAVSHRR